MHDQQQAGHRLNTSSPPPKDKDDLPPLAKAPVLAINMSIASSALLSESGIWLGHILLLVVKVASGHSHQSEIFLGGECPLTRDAITDTLIKELQLVQKNWAWLLLLKASGNGRNSKC